MPDSVGHNVACRICMDSKDNCVSLFSHDLSKKFTEVADIQVEKDDGLPETICMECESDLEKCYEFRLKVQVADKKFRENIKFSQVDIVEYNIKQEGYAGDETSENGDDRDSLSMDDDEPDVAQKNQEENDEIEPYPMNHVAVIEQREGKTKMSEDLLNRDQAMIDEPEVGKFEEPALDALTCMKEEAEAEIMDIDNNQLDPFGTSSSVRRSGSSKPKRNLPETPPLKTNVGFGMDSLHPNVASNDSMAGANETSVQGANESPVKPEENEIPYMPSSSTHSLKSNNNKSVPRSSKKFKTRNKRVVHKQSSAQLQKQCDSESFSDGMSQESYSKALASGDSSDDSDLQLNSVTSVKNILFSAQEQIKRREPFCPVCNVSYGSNELLNEHRGKRGFICRVCAAFFDSHLDLEGHFTTHQTYNCKVCGEMFFCKIDLYQHKKISELCNKQVLFECEMCNKKFSRERNLRSHKSVYHSDHVENFECVVCKKTFKTSFLLTNHLRHSHVVHEYIECSICHTLCLGPERLKTHFKSHNEESQFPCPDCGEVFNKKSLLRSHMPSHDFSINLCEICGESIRGKVAMKNHIDYKHQTGTFICNLCNMKFDTKRKMVIHRKSHNRRYLPKPSICEICGKEFNSTQVLKNHLRIHFDERPFKCDICGASFKQKVSLRNHHRTHSDIGQYCCIACGKTFKWKQTYDKHIKSCKFKFESIPGSTSE